MTGQPGAAAIRIPLKSAKFVALSYKILGLQRRRNEIVTGDSFAVLQTARGESRPRDGVTAECEPRRIRHWMLVAACVIGLAFVTPFAAHAEPAGGPPPGPYPDANLIIRYYDPVRYDDYFTNSAGGVWFSTPLGLNCGIWDRGSFGCTGDIRGAPPGTTNIGWVNGNIVTRYDWLLGVQFPPGRAERDLAPRSYIEYNGTRCATMADSSTFCSRGPYKFFVTPTQTWLSPP